jgi:arylsulfatase A-like enzyme
MPTLLSALGLPVPRAVEGADLSVSLLERSTRSHTAKLTHYRTRLQRRMNEHNDQFESCTWYRDHWTTDRNIVNTAMGVKQDLAALDRIVQQTAREIEANPEK